MTRHVEEETEVGPLDGGLHVASLEDDIGALAAQLEGDSLKVGCGLRLDDLPNLGGASEGDFVDLGVAGNGSTSSRSVPRDDVDDAGREASFLDQFGNVEPGEWSLSSCYSIH